MRYPDFLTDKGTIGFVAPAFGCAMEPYQSAFNNAQKILKDKGHKLILGPNCYEGSGIGISNTPKACGDELTEYYVNQDCDILLSCGGGELMCEVVNFIDFDAISKARPKWYMGYSDNTNFTFLSATLADTAAIYGPCAPAFGMEPWHPAIQDAYDLLTGKKLEFTGYDKWEMDKLKSEEDPLIPYNVTEPSIIKTYAPTGKSASDLESGIPESMIPGTDITIKGRLLGGCLDCLVNLVGTKFDRVAEFNNKYGDDGIIWFLEACDLNVFSIRRAMWQLKNAGWFDKVSGFIIGRPLQFGQEMFGLDQYKAVVDIISEFNVPILMDADIGHHPPMIPLVCGAMATVTTSGNTYQVKMDLN